MKWFTDNQAVAKIITSGSVKEELQKIAVYIFSFCVTNNISLEVEWIPRTENERAYYISRIVDADDWAVSDIIFNQCEQMFTLTDLPLILTLSSQDLPQDSGIRGAKT